MDSQAFRFWMYHQRGMTSHQHLVEVREGDGPWEKPHNGETTASLRQYYTECGLTKVRARRWYENGARHHEEHWAPRVGADADTWLLVQAGITDEDAAAATKTLLQMEEGYDEAHTPDWL